MRRRGPVPTDEAIPLGERFRGFETRRETAGLETSGPYAYVRHPGYLALMLTDLGAPLVLGVPLMAIAWIVPQR